MKKFLLAGVLGALLCSLPIKGYAQVAEKVENRKAFILTRDNLVSLRYTKLSTTKQPYDQSYSIVIQNNSTKQETIIDGKIESERLLSPLSNNQLNALIKKFNQNHLVALEGEYKFTTNTRESEYIALEASDSNNRDFYFSIGISGDADKQGEILLKDFFDFKRYLFSVSKLPAPLCPGGLPLPEPLVNWQNFSSLILETSGGFAGIRSQIKISANPQGPSSAPWTIQRSETVAGKTVEEIEKLSFYEEKGFIGFLNYARLDANNGKSWEQKDLRDGFNQVVTLQLRDGRKFIVSNYGDTAPPEYSALVQYLNELKDKTLATK